MTIWTRARKRKNARQGGSHCRVHPQHEPGLRRKENENKIRYDHHCRAAECRQIHLLNALVGEKVAIVSHKPQTTRNRICGIVTRGDTQFVVSWIPPATTGQGQSWAIIW